MHGAVRRAVFLVAVLLVASVAGARPQEGTQPGDETEVFTGTEDVPGGARRELPALRYWRVRATLRVPAGARGRVAVLVPLSDGRQDVLARRVTAPGFRFRELEETPNLRAEWLGDEHGGGTMQYDLAVRIVAAPHVLPALAVRDVAPPPAGEAMALPSAQIQTTAPEVGQRAREIVGTSTRVDEVVWALYQHTAAFLPAADPPGPQDAVTVLAARRGTSLGRARALVALLSAAGVPARLVGGLRLANASERRATNSWVEAWTGGEWVPLDAAGGHYATLPNSYLALYRGDVPLIVHTAGVDLEYGFSVRETTRKGVEESDEPEVAVAGGREPTVRGPGRHPVETHAAYVSAPVASVVLIADQSVPAAATDRILTEARAASIDCVLLTARFESRYFRESYLSRLVAANVDLIRQANLVLVATADDAGLYALLHLGERGVRMPDSRIVAAGAMRWPAALMLGSLLVQLVGPGEVVLVPRPAGLLPLWEVARANLIDGVPMPEEAARWGIEARVVGSAGARLPRWRLPLRDVWARVVRAQVPLPVITLILVLPILATLAVIARLVVGLETFGIFGPVIVSLAFLTTGLRWGTVIFVTIVGLGVCLRAVLQRLRLQAVARLAILIALVAVVMGGLTAVGASLGIGPLLNISIFPMVIMSNVIEHFAASQAELGTLPAVRMTLNTLLLAVACYLAVDRSGLSSLLLAWPEVLLVSVALDVVVGRWRGMRLLEYLRFRTAVDRPA
ncbi:MAG: 7TM domain-containing protein [Candidatus Binatia bacterium]